MGEPVFNARDSWRERVARARRESAGYRFELVDNLTPTLEESIRRLNDLAIRLAFSAVVNPGPPSGAL